MAHHSDAPQSQGNFLAEIDLCFVQTSIQTSFRCSFHPPSHICRFLCTFTPPNQFLNRKKHQVPLSLSSFTAQALVRRKDSIFSSIPFLKMSYMSSFNSLSKPILLSLHLQKLSAQKLLPNCSSLSPSLPNQHLSPSF